MVLLRHFDGSVMSFWKFEQMQMQMSTFRWTIPVKAILLSCDFCFSTPFLTKCIVSTHYPYIRGSKNHTCLFWTENSYVTSRSNWACCFGLWTFVCLSGSSDKAAQRSTACPLIVYKWGLKSILYFCERCVCARLHPLFTLPVIDAEPQCNSASEKFLILRKSCVCVCVLLVILLMI